MYPFFIAMLRKSLKQALLLKTPSFSFKNTFSTGSFFEILNHRRKKYMKISLKMSHKHLLGDFLICFFIRKVKIRRKYKAYFKTNGQFSNVCRKERRYREFTFLTSLISLSLLHTVTLNVHDPKCNIHNSVLPSSKEGTHHKRNIYHFVIVVSLFT